MRRIAAVIAIAHIHGEILVHRERFHDRRIDADDPDGPRLGNIGAGGAGLCAGTALLDAPD
jgi:hypothetical protein